MKKIFCLSVVFVFCFVSLVSAKRLHKERWYQEKFCPGKTEVVMPDRTRCDCITSKNAIEFDFGSKWAEAVGQSLNYGLQTGKRPGIYLILESEKDYKYWIRLNTVIENYNLPIDTWKVTPND